MKIQKVIPSGYCKGVVSAIQIAKNTRLNHPDEKIYVLGMIVHNTYVTKALEALNIITLDDHIKSKEEWIEEIEEGIIIFTAHGISDQIKQKVADKGLHYVDASCGDVIKTQNIIKEYIRNGYEILYIGKKNHPEAMAVLSISEHIHLVSQKEDLEHIHLEGQIFVTNQTTMSLFEVEDTFKRIQEKWPQAIIHQEICHATSSRQKAIMNLKDCDLLIVVGDPKSNNSNKLKEIGQKSGIQDVLMIETALEIKKEDLIGKENVYVTAGASTPTYLTNQVLELLNHFNETQEIKNLDIVISDII